jgi:hypothetical protein
MVYFSECCALTFYRFLTGESANGSKAPMQGSIVLTFARTFGTAFRVAALGTYVSTVVLFSFYLQEKFLFAHDIMHTNPTVDFATFCVALAFLLACIDLLLVNWSFAILHLRSKLGLDVSSSMFYCVPFLFASSSTNCKQARDEAAAVQKPQPNTTAQTQQPESVVFVIFLYGINYSFGILTMHTLLSNMFFTKNPFFAILIGSLALGSIVSAIDDITRIWCPSPCNYMLVSPFASKILSLRCCFVMPLAILWQVVAIAASLAPS